MILLLLERQPQARVFQGNPNCCWAITYVVILPEKSVKSNLIINNITIIKFCIKIEQ